MGWLHVARVAGLDGAGAWLVVPAVDEPVLRWAMARQGAAVRELPGLRGWLVPLAAEGVLWGVVAATCGPAAVCAACLHDVGVCDGWEAVLRRRFEAAAAATALPPPRAGEPAATAWDPRPDRRWSRARPEPPPPPRPPPRSPPPTPPDPAAALGAHAAALGIAWPATRADVARAFRRAALRCHPDLGGTDVGMRVVLAAREALLVAAGG